MKVDILLALLIPPVTGAVLYLLSKAPTSDTLVVVISLTIVLWIVLVTGAVLEEVDEK